MNETKKTKKGSGLKGLEPYYIIIGIIIILLIIILSLIKSTSEKPVVEAEYETYTEVPEFPEEPEPDRTVETVRINPAEKSPAAPPEKPEPDRGQSLTFVIDDVGNSIEQLKPFLEIPYPVTFAIMPDRKYSRECATMIAAAGKDYILHQPMEALSGADPGRSAIYKGMSGAEIAKVLEHNFRQLPGAKGMNNHMGSAATSDPEVMKAVMNYLSNNNKFFLDSFTISSSYGSRAASEFKVSYLKRNSMFLDNENDHESIQNAINEGKKTARKNGHAVMIGHVMSEELAELMLELYPNFIDDGFSLKDISELFIAMNSQELPGE